MSWTFPDTQYKFRKFVQQTIFNFASKIYHLIKSEQLLEYKAREHCAPITLNMHIFGETCNDIQRLQSKHN